MPRGRILNKKISYDEKVAKLSLGASLLYTWCIPHLDVKGRIYATPEILKGVVVPYVKELTLEKIKECLIELQNAEDEKGEKLVLIYGNCKYIQFNGFFKNQDVREDREAPSEIPNPKEFLDELEINQGQVGSNSGVGQEQLPSKSGVTQGQSKSKYKVKVNINIYSQNIFDYWNSKSSVLITHRQLTEKIETKIKSRLKENTEEEIKQAIDNYAEVLSHPEVYYFNYKWTLADFMQRGVDKFLSSADPLNNFKKKGDINAKNTGSAIRDIKYTPKQRNESTV